DEKGRLVMVMQKAATAGFIRRITYSYAGNDRLVGRLVEYAEVDLGGNIGPWRIEDRQAVLDADHLPADTTFVWDPIVDRLVSIFKAGASENPLIDTNGGLLRQIIH